MERRSIPIYIAKFGVILTLLIILLTYAQRHNNPIQTGANFPKVVHMSPMAVKGERLAITATTVRPPITTAAERLPITVKAERIKPQCTTNCLQGKVLVTPSEKLFCGVGNRLGNKLSMISAAIGAVVAKNMTFVLIQPSHCKWVYRLQELFTEFQTTPVVPFKEVKRWRSVDEKEGFVYTDIPSDGNVSLNGYRQTWEYFSSRQQQEAVRQAFTFTKSYENHARKTLSIATNMFNHIQQPILVGVHMRLGDIVKSKTGKRIAGKTFYDIVFKTVETHFNNSKNIIFVAGSDSPKLGKEMLADASKIHNIFWTGGTDLEDFATLCNCNHSVISGGTFGFWTAWLAGGQTFYNANFSIPNTFWGSWYIEENANLPDWIPVSWL